MSIFAEITEDLTALIENDLFSRSVDLIANVAPLFAAGFGLYVALVMWGYQKMGLDDSISDLAKKMAGWLIIIALAFNAGNYSILAQSIYAAPDEVASWLTGNTLSSSFVETQLNNVDAAIAKIRAMSQEVGTLDVGAALTLGLAQLVVFIVGYISVIFIWGFYMITKFSLALTLVLGPVFIGAMLFPATRQYGMNWIGQCLNYIITVSLYMGISLIQLNYVQSTFDSFEIKTEWKQAWHGLSGKEVAVVETGPVWGLMGNLIIITIIFAPIVFSIPHIASALTGGAGVDGHGRIMERAARGAATGGIGAFKFAGRQVNRLRGNKMSRK